MLTADEITRWADAYEKLIDEGRVCQGSYHEFWSGKHCYCVWGVGASTLSGDDEFQEWHADNSHHFPRIRYLNDSGDFAGALRMLREAAERAREET